MSRLKKMIEARKQKMRLHREMELRNGFEVVERNGRLWFTHYGVAFMKVTDAAMVESVTQALSEVRDIAVEFEKL